MAGIEIPEYCGAILLPDATLFPHGAFPLHIFEPRYREMLSDALASHCMICVGNLISEETANPKECTAPVGTIGLIRASREQSDGRSNLILHGILRVDFEAWLDEKSYPYAQISPSLSNPLPEGAEEKAITTLRDAVNLALKPFPEATKKQVNATLDRAADSPVVLADAIAQQFIQDPRLRRKLLEETDVSKRFAFLTHFLRNAAPPEEN